MTRRRFYVPPDDFAPASGSLTLPPEEARHLRDVLRLEPGDEVSVFNGQGQEFRCSISKLGRNFASLVVIEEVAPAKPESPLLLTLAIALLKGDKFDLVVQKATELGVHKIVPVMTKLADVRLRNEADAGKRVGRWQRIALEATKQSGRAFVPHITEPVSFDSLINAPPTHSQRLMFSERGGTSLTEATREFEQQSKQIIALVGSEGGWTTEEIEQAQRAGWFVVTLGGRTLRAETAAIAIVALLQHLFGDLK